MSTEKESLTKRVKKLEAALQKTIGLSAYCECNCDVEAAVNAVMPREAADRRIKELKDRLKIAEDTLGEKNICLCGDHYYGSWSSCPACEGRDYESRIAELEDKNKILESATLRDFIKIANLKVIIDELEAAVRELEEGWRERLNDWKDEADERSPYCLEEHQSEWDKEYEKFGAIVERVLPQDGGDG